MSPTNDWPAEIPSQSIAGKVAVVTGGGSAGDLPGTGAAIAHTLSLSGATVFIVERDRERAENTQRRIQAAGGAAEVLLADITSFSECERIVSEVMDKCGRLDVLVNNVGVMPVPEQELGDRGEVFEQTLGINLTAPRNLIFCAAPHMAATEDSSIVNIISIAAMRASASLAYAASKGGLMAMTRAAARLYGPDGIRVNAIAPGYIETPMAGPRVKSLRDAGAQTAMLTTPGSAWDVANTVLFLACEQSRWITGVTLPVDAGTTALLPSGAGRPAPVTTNN